MAELETAEEFACKRIPYIRKAADDNLDLLESVLARSVEARDKAVALRVLADLRELAASESVDILESNAIIKAWELLRAKYQEKP